MSVYVDAAMIEAHPHRGPWPAKWSHLMADTVEELHEFAARLGLRRSWYQERPQPWLCHYDVTKGIREQAIKLGAIPETRRESAMRLLAAAKSHKLESSR